MEKKEYRYNVLDLQKNKAIGIKLPMSLDKGVFQLSYTTEEQAISNLKNLLLTQKGERVYHPDFGTNLRKFLFENINNTLIENIADDINDAIEFWLTYIIIDDIIIDQIENALNIELHIRVTEQGANRRIIIYAEPNNVQIINII